MLGNGRAIFALEHWNSDMNPLFTPTVIRSPAMRPSSRPETVINRETGRLPPGISANGGAGDRRQMLYIPLDPTRPDAPQILAHLQALSLYFGRSPYVREFTRSILPMLGDNAQDEIVQVVTAFVRQRLKYLADPEGTEFVISPIVLLAQIQAGQTPLGDCDDHVLLLNSMLRSMGFDTRVVGVKLNMRDRWDHVISAVNVFGTWRDIDPCAKGGWTPFYSERLVGQ